jgi:hypothetical protein
MARQYPRGHNGIKPGEVANDTSVNHLTRQAPDLTEDRAKQLEIKLEVTMAKIESYGGEGDASVQGAINKISRTGGIPSLDLPIGHHLSGGLRRSSSESSAAAAR